MHSGGRKLHQLMVIADCPLRSFANGGLYVRDEAESDMETPPSFHHAMLPASHSLSFDHRRLPP